MRKTTLIATLLIAAVATGGWTLFGPKISADTEAKILEHKSGGKACVTAFPESWGKNDIIKHVKEIGANKDLKWSKVADGNRSIDEKVDGVKIRVVVDQDHKNILSAKPLSGDKNPCTKKAAEPVKAKKVKATSKPSAKPVSVKQEVKDAAPNQSNRKPSTSNFNSGR